MPASEPSHAGDQSNECESRADTETKAQLEVGLGHHQAGRLADAERAYLGVLEKDPNHAVALHLLALLMNQHGQHDRAVELIQRSVKEDPEYAAAYYDLGNILRDLGREEEAERSFCRAVELWPDWPEAQYNYGLLLEARGKLNAAEASYRSAVAAKKDYAKALLCLAAVLRKRGNFSEAVANYQTLLSFKPDDAELHNSLGAVLMDQGKLDEAAASYQQALSLKPDYPEAYYNLGNLMMVRKQFETALASYDRAIEIKADFAEAYANRGSVLRELKQLDAAVASHDKAIAIKPDFAEAYTSRGNALYAQGRLDEAIESHRKALLVNPDFSEAYSNLLFCLIHDEHVTPEASRAEHFAYAERFEGPLRLSWQPHSNDRNPDRQLKVGFVSGDLRDHAVARFVEPVWAALAPQAIELWVYSNHWLEDAGTARLRRFVPRWRVVVGLSDEVLAETIRADGIDVLIDLSGHTGHNRLLTFARKPAPVQATWIGYPGTTGLQAIDYVICDRFNAPHGLYERCCSERFARLPSAGAFEPGDAPAVNALPALSNGFVTFVNFNRPNKLGEQVVAAWSRVLEALPEARLLLANVSEAALAAALTARFGCYGIPPERLRFQPFLPFAGYLALHHEVDIVLDTFPYAGGTTTNYALWMGVPVVTMRGPSRAHCQGAAAMGRMGLDDWVADDVTEFVGIAVEMAQDIEALGALRRGMRERWSNSPWRQNRSVARGLEAALRVMWKRWCAGLPAADFEVPTAAIEQVDSCA